MRQYAGCPCNDGRGSIRWIRRLLGLFFLLGCTEPQGGPAGPTIPFRPSSTGEGAPSPTSDGAAPAPPPADDAEAPPGQPRPEPTPDPHDGSVPPESHTPMPPMCLSAAVDGVRGDLATCRACHNGFGLARDSRFILTQDSSQDAESLELAYQSLGRELLAMPSEEAGRDHPGGTQVSPGTPSYVAWQRLIDTLASPETACADEVPSDEAAGPTSP